MAKAKVGAAGIEYIQGAMKRPKKKDGHSHGNYLVMTHRSAPTTNPDCQRVYTFDADRYDRTTPITQKEASARLRFSTVAAMIKERKEDLSKIATDQAAFLAQKDLPNGKKTMKAYYWYICGQEYDNPNG